MTNDPRTFTCFDDFDNNGFGQPLPYIIEIIEIDNDEADEYNPEIEND